HRCFRSARNSEADLAAACDDAEQRCGHDPARYADSRSDEREQYDYRPVHELYIEPDRDAADHGGGNDPADCKHYKQPAGFCESSEWRAVSVNSVGADAGPHT